MEGKTCVFKFSMRVAKSFKKHKGKLDYVGSWANRCRFRKRMGSHQQRLFVESIATPHFLVSSIETTVHDGIIGVKLVSLTAAAPHKVPWWYFHVGVLSRHRSSRTCATPRYVARILIDRGKPESEEMSWIPEHNNLVWGRHYQRAFNEKYSIDKRGFRK